MKNRNLIILFIFVIVVLMFPAILIINNLKPTGDIKEATFSKLKDIRLKKKKEAVEYFQDIQRLASEIKDDEVMLASFNIIKQKDYRTDDDLEYELDKHYVIKYGNFYDILFIDSTGFVFHSIKQESDYHKNLFEGNLADTKLAKMLKQRMSDHFIEYDYYSPSDEPAAFFAVSLKEEGKQTGWIVLQCPINTMNTILTDRKNLGRTGEVYLVNSEKLMLSDSRFIEDGTILKIKVDTWAVKEALRNNNGESIIEDYRCVRVFSSYEKFDLFGICWIIITEIDEDEVITEYYKRNKKQLHEVLCNYIADLKHANQTDQYTSIATKRVDMNEFVKAEPGVVLKTSGVSTCTAIAILYPEKFGYLAHIAPVDDIYGSSPLTKLILNNKRNDFFGELIRRITYYDCYPYELKQLQFVIIAPHPESFRNAVEKILDIGAELSNIKFMFNPAARCANVILDTDDNLVSVEWKSKRLTSVEFASDLDDLGALLKTIINYNT